MAVAPSSTQLGCGRDMDQVWDQLDGTPDAHELTCPFCRTARADLGHLRQATDALRTGDATNPDAEPSPRVLDRILSIARAEVRRGRRLPLDRPTSDQTSSNTVSEQAVAAAIRRIGDQNGHVQIRRCTLTYEPGTTGRDAWPSAAEVPVDPIGDPGPAALRVSLQVSVASGLSIAEASDQLRAAVIFGVAREIGLDVVSVDVGVEDLHDA